MIQLEENEPMGPWWMTVGTLEGTMRSLKEKGAELETGRLTSTGAAARVQAAMLEATGALARTRPTAGDDPVWAAWTALSRAQAALDEAVALNAPGGPRGRRSFPG